MELTKMQEYVGATGRYQAKIGSAYWRVHVKVVNVRQVWGKVQFQIVPLYSEGVNDCGHATWVDSGSMGSIELKVDSIK